MDTPRICHLLYSSNPQLLIISLRYGAIAVQTSEHTIENKSNATLYVNKQYYTELSSEGILNRATGLSIWSSRFGAILHLCCPGNGKGVPHTGSLGLNLVHPRYLRSSTYFIRFAPSSGGRYARRRGRNAPQGLLFGVPPLPGDQLMPARIKS